MIVETYVNRLYRNEPTKRYWLNHRLLIGGSINDEADWKHLRDDYGITAVLNVETEHSDIDKGIPYLYETQVPDNGDRFPDMILGKALCFAEDALKPNGTKLHVKCQMGGSRSPAFGYFVLRAVFHYTPEEALAAIRATKPEYGQHHYHQAYLGSIEDFLARQNVRKRG